MFLSVLLVSLSLSSTGRAADTVPPVDFNRDVKPLLSDRCFTCHGPDEAGRKAGLRLDTPDGAFAQLDDDLWVIRPRDLERSELVYRVTTDDEDDLMPPTDSHLNLSAAARDLLVRWVREGAKFTAHWAFEPVTRPDVPSVGGSNHVRNPIDAFVLERLRREGLKPAAEADRATLLRRLSLDLRGLPPSLEELDGFIADPAPDAYEARVEAFLSSPAYGEARANEWLDLARYADTYGYQADVDRDMSVWRDWVIRAFNENLSYDDFVRWQIAGDQLPDATPETILATAFNRLHRQTNEGGSIEEEFRVEYVADRVHTMGTAFLGLTLECARCHDHRYDPISQRDYYELSAFFSSIDESGLYSHFTRATPTPTLGLYESEEARLDHGVLKARIAVEEKRLADLIKTVGERVEPDSIAGRNGRTLASPQAVAAFSFDELSEGRSPNLVSTNAAEFVDSPTLVPGRFGRAVQFDGDNSVIAKGAGHFQRTDPFSISLWIKRTEEQDRAVVLHHSRAWTDSGSRGYELLLEEGRPFFGLIHFWPGNAVAVRAEDAIPLNEWKQLAVTYDGSSRAAGIRLYLDGEAVPTTTVRDNLYRDILHRSEWGDGDVGNIHLTLGGRFRDSGFRGGFVDELRVFAEELTALEVLALVDQPVTTTPELAMDDGTPSDLLRDHLARRGNEAVVKKTAGLRELRKRENAIANAVPEIMVMKELPEPRPTYVLQRGAYDQPGERVEPDTPADILPFPDDLPRNRLGLAEWMTRRDNPLTARVVVNRAWRVHFGRGLVATPEDFGNQGDLPTHPELLDWLASWFMDNGWDVKALHRLIVTSATYRQSSRAPAELRLRDPRNSLLARGPSARLSAEQIRDSALAASGLLNERIGGPAVKPYQPAGLWEESGTGKTYRQDEGDKLYRRSLYTFRRRTAPPPSMTTFDATSREVCVARREVTATPLQSLVLMNDPQFVEAARVLAEDLVGRYPDDPDGRVGEAFQRLTGRSPDERERAILRDLHAGQLEEYRAHPEAAKALAAIGERAVKEELEAVDVAATTMMVSTVMNFDEFVMKR